MAGIQGSQASGIVFSIAMSGEYEDNEDNGDYIIYTGSGGRDPSSGSKKQTFDQTLDGRNLLLAKCCPVPIDLKNGSDAGDNWRNGVPIRVVRGSKSLRFSGSRSYGPSEGYRYDGVYKVVMYWPTKGTSGFKVWRFMLRRDDPSPTPWSIEDKCIVECDSTRETYCIFFLSLRQRFMRKHCPMYRDTQNEKRHQYWTSMRRVIDNLQPAVGYGRQAKTFDYTDTMIEQDIQATLESDKAILEKEMDRAMYIPDDPLKKTILLDAMNRRIWMRICNREYQRKVGIRDYLSFIEVAFTQPEFQCLICNDKVAHRSHKQYRDGLTIPLVHFASLHCMRCDYNFCKDCLKPMFIRDIRCCPNCLAVGSLERNINLKRVYQAAHIERKSFSFIPTQENH